MLLPVVALLMQPAGQTTNVSPRPPAVTRNANSRRLARARWLVDLFHPEAKDGRQQYGDVVTSDSSLGPAGSGDGQDRP